MKVKSQNFLLSLCAVSIALALAPAARATAIDLTLTEVDDNTLSVAGADAGFWSVTGSADSWTLTRTPSLGTSELAQVGYWIEPDNSQEVNSVDLFYTAGGALTIDVVSDAPMPTGRTVQQDGAVVTFSINLNTALIPFTVQFFDDGDAPGVPDSSSAAFCLALGLIPLVWLKHRRAVRQ